MGRITVKNKVSKMTKLTICSGDGWYPALSAVYKIRGTEKIQHSIWSSTKTAASAAYPSRMGVIV